MTETELRPENWEAVAQVEVDRYCEQCGYNLTGQIVRLHKQTQVLMVRCPECGKYHAAADSITAGKRWLRRISTLFLLMWFLLVFGAWFAVGFAECGLTVGTLFEFTQQVWEYLVVDSNEQVVQTTEGGSPYWQETELVHKLETKFPPDQGYSVDFKSRRVISPNIDEYRILVILSGVASFALGYILAMITVVACHAWRKRSAVFFVLVFALLGLTLNFTIWHYDAGEITNWGVGYFGGMFLLFVSGGLAGVLLGRPLARAMVFAFLPPRLRCGVSFLWNVDGKEVPALPRTIVQLNLLQSLL